MILADDHVITVDDFPQDVAASVNAEGPEAVSLRSVDSESSALAEVERAHILRVLQREGGNKSRTARALGIHRRKLYRLLERFEQAEESRDADEVISKS